MSEVEKCPGCGGVLAGLATFCHRCEEYVEDIGPNPSPERDHAPALPDDRLEKDIQRATKTALELLGYTVYDLSQDRATRQTAGIADLFVVGHGRCAWGEMKTQKGKQSPAQQKFEELVLANGGEYYIWRHESEAIKWGKAAMAAAA